MTRIDEGRPVAVTGATGYVAGWIVQRLLARGLTVHATVRDPDNVARRAHLDALADDSPGSIRYFRADLMARGGYAEAMEGCELVFHTASPFRIDVADPVRDLIEPAVSGARNVLEAANATPSVKRVVLTSSCAAIYGDNADVAAAPGGVLTEAVWNTSSTPDHQPYSYSKAEAEREAWRIAGAQDRWDLVAVNPSFVIGPGVAPSPDSESFRIVRRFGDGSMKAGAPDIGLGAVDVRDLADAHLAAGFTPGAEGRHIVSGHDTSFLGLAAPLIAKWGDAYPFPRRTLPKWLVWLAGPMAERTMTRRFVSRNVGRAWRADNSKSRRALGVRYRPLEDSMVEFFQQIVDAGLVTPKPG